MIRVIVGDQDIFWLGSFQPGQKHGPLSRRIDEDALLCERTDKEVAVGPVGTQRDPIDLDSLSLKNISHGFLITHLVNGARLLLFPRIAGKDPILDVDPIDEYGFVAHRSL